ncbi:unnamed protein product, partial [Rotaria magnacalcarata]
MIPRTISIETLPNEILHYILSYQSWFDMLTSFWSLNIRFNSLVRSIISINDNRLNTGLRITSDLPYNKCSTLFLLILKSSSLSSIQRIHFDETNSIASDLIYEWLFNHNNILNFPNLKSLILIRCGSIEPVVRSLFYLIEHQLDELTLAFDDTMFRDEYFHISENSSKVFNQRKRMRMIKQLICQLFSSQCHLTSLRMDLGHYLIDVDIDECLISNSVDYQHQSFCLTLRRLYIRIGNSWFLENIISQIPNLEQMSVQFHTTLRFDLSWKSNVEIMKQSNGNWLNKLPKLRYFSLKTFIDDDWEFIYLKWLLNNLNYVEKLQLHLKNDRLDERKSQEIWKSLIDANFIRQNCLPDRIKNLSNFDFYICSQRQLLFNDIEKITNSFKNHSFFLDHQWTNVNCFIDPIMLSQHIFSCFTNTFRFSHNFIKYSNVFNWPPIGDIWCNLHPSLSLILQGVNQLTPNLSCIKVYTRRNRSVDKSDFLMSLEILLKMRQYKGINIPFRNITKIQFGTHFDRISATSTTSIDRDQIREKVLAYLLSMTVQLKYLLVERVEWLLHVVEYASDVLRTNALSTVQHAEFCFPSIHYTGDKKICDGRQFVPFLSKYMPHLQTLRLWRTDDFPWTS